MDRKLLRLGLPEVRVEEDWLLQISLEGLIKADLLSARDSTTCDGSDLCVCGMEWGCGKWCTTACETAESRTKGVYCFQNKMPIAIAEAVWGERAIKMRTTIHCSVIIAIQSRLMGNVTDCFAGFLASFWQSLWGCIFRKICLRGRVKAREMERQRNLLSIHLLLRWPQLPVLSQDEARSQKLYSSLSLGGSTPSTWVIFHYLSQAIRRELDWK